MKQPEISRVKIDNEKFYKISDCHSMRPFFMSIVSDSNHWMFISSNGGLTAGRKNAEHSLFPYYTDDKITEAREDTGSKTLIWLEQNNQRQLWEPFSNRQEGTYSISRNLYKSIYGNKLIFEAINHDLELSYSYQWSSSNLFGFVRKSRLINHSNKAIKISLIDGIQNIIPAGVGSDLQNQASNLVDAYKRNELIKETGLGIYALSAIIVDKAEPSEALKANVVWSHGLSKPKHLLSSLQLKSFRKGNPVQDELDIKAEKGAYLLQSDFELSPEKNQEWIIVADVNKSHTAIAALSDKIKHQNIVELVNENIKKGTQRLIQLVAASDGMQTTADQYRDARHFSNTLFNIMRGGIFDENYKVEKKDFSQYLDKANKLVYKSHEENLKNLPEVFSIVELKELSNQSTDVNFRRLCMEYLPLKFSRRHGDPSRPWNKFSINTRSEVDGSKILDYEGNWRDIFQNWEALAYSYPAFGESMIHKFLNATTFEGYNPYRVTKDGFDWETIEPDNPWSYIGYWGDHQIIYLLKLLELLEKHFPGALKYYFDKDLFVYANVPYKIKTYQEILKNPKDTIAFDQKLDHELRERKETLGADGALLLNENGEIYSVNFIEKILATVLAKMSNFIPEGGIWMNTQRPEWNDANNALVGNGVSMVTLYYLRRFLKFFDSLLTDVEIESVKISGELLDFYKRVREVLYANQDFLSGNTGDEERKLILDGLGQAGSDYRTHVYKQAFWGRKRSISIEGLRQFIDISLQFLEHSIKLNKRSDNLYHAYNLMTVSNPDEISISNLSEMLEGQVAVLSSGYLNSTEALELLDALKKSKLFRADQYSYLLYPKKSLAGFMKKNNIPEASVMGSKLLSQLLGEGNTSIVEKDIEGKYHFNGDFKNANDLNIALSQLDNNNYSELVTQERSKLLEVYEEVFNHKEFTGRSGTFYGYEGLGSIYWHMVSKLQLAVQENCMKAINDGESEEVIGRLLEHYYEINAGIGVHKSPKLYGAFPTDPYSHTPAGKGAQQPGMTGQVKEDILSRFGELGVSVVGGKILFNPSLLRKDEFVTKPTLFKYVDIDSQTQEIELSVDTLAFTYCQVAIIYQISDKNRMEIFNASGNLTELNGLKLDAAISNEIFERKGEVTQIKVFINKNILK